MMKLRPWIAALLLLAAGAAIAAEPVRLDSGPVSGTTLAGEPPVTVYGGIPYAAPPVGKLRWRPPQPVEPWSAVRACTEFGPACPQPKALVGLTPPKQSEDCLTLNVWTPAPSPDARLPVMLWIHGGGHTTGAGSIAFYDGKHLARDGGVVLVTINYRLGPFGYMAHPLLSKESEHGVSGNYGLLDQIASLRWVQRNIAGFGGDPGRVTIFGESAGAVSVCRLMVSPLAKGLFHRAIAQSGGAHGRNRHLRQTRPLQEAMEKVGERIARSLGCDGAPDPLAAMRARTPQELLDATSPAQGLYGRGLRFGPVVDGYAIPEDPPIVFQEGRQHDVPFLTGSNADEGTLFLRQLPVRGVVAYRRMLKRFFGDHTDRVFELFPARTRADVREAASRLAGISAFVAPARCLVRAMEKVPSPAWLYHFTRVPQQSKAKGLGAFHGLEIAYVFGTLEGRTGFDQADRTLARTMLRCWARFAATGDPNGPGLPEWPAYRTATDQHLEFGVPLRIDSGLHKEACDVFETFYAERLAKLANGGK